METITQLEEKYENEKSAGKKAAIKREINKRKSEFDGRKGLYKNRKNKAKVRDNIIKSLKIWFKDEPFKMMLLDTSEFILPKAFPDSSFWCYNFDPEEAKSMIDRRPNNTIVLNADCKAMYEDDNYYNACWFDFCGSMKKCIETLRYIGGSKVNRMDVSFFTFSIRGNKFQYTDFKQEIVEKMDSYMEGMGVTRTMTTFYKDGCNMVTLGYVKRKKPVTRQHFSVNAGELIPLIIEGKECCNNHPIANWFYTSLMKKSQEDSYEVED